MNGVHLLLCVLYVDPCAEPTLLTGMPWDVIYVRNSEFEMTEALRFANNNPA